MSNISKVIKSNGYDLNLQIWETSQTSKGIVQIVHGISEHIGRYEHMASILNKSGYHIIGHDHRGHGHSGGEKVFVSDFDVYTADIHLVMQTMRAKYQDLPHYFFGHSMGGLITLKYVLDYKPTLAGMILSGPALKISKDFPPLLQKTVSFLGSIFPHLKTQKLEIKYISRDPEVIKKYDEDPLVYKKGIKAGFAKAMLRATYDVEAKLKHIDCPFLVMQGMADRLVDPEGAALLFREARSIDKSKKYYPGLFHEIFNEPEKEQVLQDIVEWLDKRAVINTENEKTFTS